MRQSFYDFCVSRGREDLLAEWDNEKNQPLHPSEVSYGSNKSLHWTCARGHTWEAPVSARTAGRGCPCCAGRRAWPGENDLASCRPELAAEWDADRNAPLTPETVPIGSHRRVWWRCARGHSWQSAIRTRAAGAACPVCAGKRLDPAAGSLAVAAPALAAEWEMEKNRPLTPDQVPLGTNRRVWWRCGQGHQWRAAVSSRTRGSGCPVCAGKVVVAGENDLGHLFPAIAAQWHPEKNGPLTPADCAPASNRKVWWRCTLGHAYQAAVGARTVNGAGCPYCAGRKVLRGFNDLATTAPLVAAQWHPARNGALTPADVTAGSARKVWWQCPLGHSWQAVIYSRAGAQQAGCPECAGRIRRPRRMDALPAERREAEAAQRI